MYVKSISLFHFRNLHNMTFNLSEGINIFYGDNAQGKTNLLESIYLCATGRSQRTRMDGQLVAFEEEEAHIQLYVQKEKHIDKIDAHIRREGRKGIAINGIPAKKSSDLFGTLYVVFFSPEDLQLVKSGPAERRRFLDLEICQLSGLYYHDLQQYYKVLKQRNNLLKKIQKNADLKETIFVWDQQLIHYGAKIMKARQNFVKNISEIACQKHHEITGGLERLIIEYKPYTETDQFEKKLINHLDRDIFIGSTTVGPHKDDLEFLINEKDVKNYGSQGQQRTAVLSAKLAEIELIKQEAGTNPVLLLDDVLSELDKSRQLFLIHTVMGLQTVITCTGIEDALKKYIKGSMLYHVKQGVIERE